MWRKMVHMWSQGSKVGFFDFRRWCCRILRYIDTQFGVEFYVQRLSKAIFDI